MSKPRVSVALATYNGERFLREQLDSLAAQTLLPWELVVCDDGSSDDTLAIVESFAARSSFPVKLHRNPERLDFADNFLKAAGLCKGEFVSFCDQDDVWHSDKIARSVQALATSGAVLCAHDAIKIDEEGRTIGHDRRNFGADTIDGWRLDPWTVFPGFTCTFRRELLYLAPAAERPIDVIDPRRRLSHDRWVYFLAGATGRIAYIAEPLADWRQHGGNASGWMRTSRGWPALLGAARERFGFHLEKRQQIAGALADLADEIELGDDPRWSKDNLARAREVWQREQAAYRTRRAIAATDGLFSRGRALLRALHASAYRDSRTGKMKPRALAQDLVAALLAHPGQIGRAPVSEPPPAYQGLPGERRTMGMKNTGGGGRQALILHLGAGPYARQGWFNTNWFPIERGSSFLDATKPFPLPDDAFDYVHSEHVIEHIPQEGGRNMLAECYRVMRPGGRIRIATPDLGFLLAMFDGELDEGQRHYLETCGEMYGIDPTPIAVLNHNIRTWGHVFVYTREALQDAMREAGFVRIEACGLNESGDPVLADLEHPERLPPGFLDAETMTYEGVKPS